ncbi:DNA/RNA polymerase [Rhizophagus irregularis]|uniref:DNA-directed DNA polymerase n=1 Tax=Rhizophagus irregularis TaxID=588596 RepID=A0A2N1M4B5_9GLOM|nr:DNA/RNA polymerase [Rhizophagus irregularis]
MKVRNLLGAYAFKRDMVFSTRVCENIEKGKYPGAYIFPPKKGIESRRPVTGLDFASLYPSLIMAYNLSSDKIILTHGEADIKGLYPVVLEYLFNKRVELKTHLALLGKKKRHLEKMISSAKEKGNRIPESLNSEYSSSFEGIYEHFYGEAGNSKSPIFLRELAGGTTSAGKFNLNLVVEFVTKKGFGIKYGDTDSLYLTCPDKYYEKCDKAFSRKELSKEEYWTEMVEITMDMMKRLRDQVNAYLRIKSSTSCLKMAYEEVLFPVCFTGKKKYFGIRHEDVVNFRPDNLFMRGIDTVKQGNFELFRFIREKIMWEAMGINNTRSIHEIVKDALRDARFKQCDFNQFIAISKWKAKGGLPCNKIFMERMRERIASGKKNIKIPDSGEHYCYVVVNDSPRYKEDGTKSTRKAIIWRMCARFINEDDSFQPPPSDKIMQIKDSDKREKEIDDYSQKKAKNWLKRYIKGLQ